MLPETEAGLAADMLRGSPTEIGPGTSPRTGPGTGHGTGQGTADRASHGTGQGTAVRTSHGTGPGTGHEKVGPEDLGKHDPGTVLG